AADAGRACRSARRPHAHRIPAPGDPGRPARPHLHPLAAPRRRPWRRLRVLRAGDRHPRREHPPKARARPAGAALRADGLRGGLPVRGRSRVSPRRRWPPRSRPPWWPEGEPWPPDRQRPWGWQRGFGCLFALAFLLVLGSVVGLVGTVISHGGHPALLPGLIVVVVLIALAGRFFRRTAGTLDELSDAAR